MIFSMLAIIAAAYAGSKLIPAGLSKFDDEKSSQLFAALGGDKVRFMVGAAEVFGSLLLLTPWTVSFGLALIFPVMAGAIYLHVMVWKNSPQNALLTLGAAILTAILWAL